jgi:hypothetical protein
MTMSDQIQNEHSPLSDWTSDWLYKLILAELDSWCKCSDSEPDCYYLIEEYDNDDGSICSGSMMRAWVRDKHGVSEISIQEALALEKLRLDEYRFRYECLAHFHIQPDREHVVYGWYSPFHIGGNGGKYRVVGRMENATLESAGGGWIS